MVEWNENEGTIKRTYQGFQKRSLGVVQFDTTKNRFLAVGDDYSIKFWDMDNPSLLTTIDTEGGLPVSSCLNHSQLHVFVQTYYGLTGFCILISLTEDKSTYSIQ
jgi:WD40 repeat protein